MIFDDKLKDTIDDFLRKLDILDAEAARQYKLGLAYENEHGGKRPVKISLVEDCECDFCRID